jgi:hypothetical protein
VYHGGVRRRCSQVDWRDAVWKAAEGRGEWATNVYRKKSLKG